MYFNNSQCDVYIGTGAGKKLMKEIAQARESIRIVSPFLSAKLVEGLVHLYHKGVEVELITTESELKNNGFHHKLIIQRVHVDWRAHHQRKRLKHILLGCGISLGTGVLVAWLFFSQEKVPELLHTLAVMAFLVVVFLLLRFALRKKKSVFLFV
ncbi:hypothetical protein PY092_12435 [Muricauda sp. 334s03]|uniref:Uncharacterized protein n=1 Tax=Flagellimonas yonaguniensis TaxID=3031325 RepID=A0ABT5Y0V5_9FLAO|nr:hypothetical protein [[Muricauda] yonaguniensis]MDF0716961.1 hypothetical protein [[Muricauda] yonaguniensis]